MSLIDAMSKHDHDRSSTARTHEGIHRRTILSALGLAGAALLVGCGDDTSATTDTDGGSTGDGGSTSDAATTGGSTGAGAECGDAATAWASGGTASMTAKDCYPNPFAAGVSSCLLLCETTEGPCTADTLERQDVSEGFTGLPVRLSLLLVDADTCAPVEGARVEIWHTQRTGVYSGMTPSGMMCYGDDPDAVNYLYFRGSQTAGADGRVDFDTCFPGWYEGRAVHIHFRVYRGSDTYTTSQLFFDDALVSEVFAGHPEYSEFGQPDTTSATDNVIGGEDDKTPYTLEVARMPDGVMLASKVIAIRSSLDQSSCTAQGAGGNMPPP